MGTYHWGSGHYKQYHFAAFHWGGVLAPVPIVPPASQGGVGLWPYWRIEEKPEICEEWAKDNIEKFKCEVPKWKKNLEHMDPMEAVEKKKEISEIEKKNKAIRSLQEEVKRLARELDRTQEEGETDKKSRQRMRLKIKRLLRTISELMERIGILEAEVEELRKQAAESSKIAPLPIPAPVAESVSPVDRELAFATEYRNLLVGRLRRSAPWALGATVTYLGTRHLVPKNMPALKFVGYAGTATLSLVAVFKFLDVDFGFSWLKPAVSA